VTFGADLTQRFALFFFGIAALFWVLNGLYAVAITSEPFDLRSLALPTVMGSLFAHGLLVQRSDNRRLTISAVLLLLSALMMFGLLG
jgi:hypothetical protein